MNLVIEKRPVVWGYDDVTDTDYINYEETAKNLIANGVTIPVMCKECKHYIPQSKSAHWNCKTMYCCRSATVKVNPEDFCSYGERKEE